MTTSTKEQKALAKIADTIDNLEETLSTLKGNENKLKIWYEQKKATYEIKKIVHESTTYGSYNEAEYQAFLYEYNSFIFPENINSFKM